ncbi:hypothetical protein TanjilG_02371 [Lupinus angustifolius]|uniref:MADS-box domain-containing protein n=1 Tax=Lupinus angustifolius TaxID=3871 RepID=A0A1J7HNW6_LUPAN|nr:hypothetical protein TanjilG_02371 [Lupinus angustifolius]
MGRVKLKIKKLENTNGRQATYAKRKNGIIKKASELSILCDIDIILLMFSPTGKPSLCRGRRSHWTDFGKISDAEKLEQMENSLKESLNQIRTCKENIQKQQLASLQCNNNQFNEMRIPFIMNADQHLQPLSWIANSDSQNMVLQEDSRFLQHRDVEGSTSSSFGTYASYLGSSSKTDISNSGQENGVLSDLSSNAPVRLQLNGQFPCQPYNFNVLNDIKFQLEAEMNPHENHVDYHVNGRFEAPRPGYDSNQYNWTSTSGPCAVTMLDEYLISQTSFPQVHFGFT